MQTFCTACKRPLWVRYDFELLKREFKKRDLAGRPPTIWRYLEMLPFEEPESMVTLTETITPILAARRLGAELAADELLIKDDSRLPTGSAKARAMAMAITMAKELGVSRVAIASNGNAASAMAAYAARADIEAFVFLPKSTPIVHQKECQLAGAKVYLVEGSLEDCDRLIQDGEATMDWLNLGHFREPYRLEGEKTLGFELAEQFDWKLPDVIVYPTGSGSALIGLRKAFDELEDMGWLPENAKRPRLIACQSDGCDPLAQAFAAGQRFAKRHENGATAAAGIQVAESMGDFMLMDAVKSSGGSIVSAPEADLINWMRLSNSLEGIAIGPETALCLSAIERLLKEETLKPDERIVVVNTAAVQKYVELTPDAPGSLNLEQSDWDAIAEGR